MFIAGRTIGFETCGNRCTGLDRLLIEASFFARLTVETLRTDRDKMAVHVAALLGRKPLQRLEAGREPLLV